MNSRVGFELCCAHLRQRAPERQSRELPSTHQHRGLPLRSPLIPHAVPFGTLLGLKTLVLFSVGCGDLVHPGGRLQA